MNLKELLAAMNAAKTALDAKPEDTALKAAYLEEKSKYETALADSEDDEDDEDEDEESEADKKKKKKPASGKQDDEEDQEPSQEQLDEMIKDPAKAKAYIKSLRKENAKHRTGKKNLDERLGKLEKGLKSLVSGDDDEEDSLSPEEKLETLTQRTHVEAYQRAILEKAVDNGITGKDGRELFEFYVSKAANELEEGEELDDDAITEIAEKVKKLTGVKKSAKTSVGGGEPNPEGGDDLTLDAFCAMTTTEKTNLFQKQNSVYNKLFKEAVAKGRL